VAHEIELARFQLFEQQEYRLHQMVLSLNAFSCSGARVATLAAVLGPRDWLYAALWPTHGRL